MIRLLYPLGKSPKVFTKGWVFGAQAMYMPKEKMNDDDADPINLSDKIEWSGSGSFKPKIGKKSRPSFNGPGTNTIVLTVEADGKKVTKTVKVEAVSPAGYATAGATATAKCAHGCPACPHDVKGVFAGGSSAVLIDGKPALRVGDGGKHTFPCCGPNTFKVVEGDPSVVINGKQAVKYGATTQHCGGVGTVTRN